MGERMEQSGGVLAPAGQTDGTPNAPFSVDHGVGATGVTQPVGGVGLLGWLSGIYNRLGAALTVGSITAAVITYMNTASSTNGGLVTVVRLLSAAATTNATSVKGAGGRLYKIFGYNAAASLRYLKLYNKATAPTVGTDTPVATFALAPSSSFTIDFVPIGVTFTTGIAFAITTGSGDADTGALTAGDVIGLNAFYQ